jgi:hypothetical protein
VSTKVEFLIFVGVPASIIEPLFVTVLLKNVELITLSRFPLEDVKMAPPKAERLREKVDLLIVVITFAAYMAPPCAPVVFPEKVEFVIVIVDPMDLLEIAPPAVILVLFEKMVLLISTIIAVPEFIDTAG